ncbi:MAG TPA: TIGR03118 family protein [Bryobacteraceae bacterium]|nr:TIGR03118 family protein [Bryobacteraceae bacterium]
MAITRWGFRAFPCAVAAVLAVAGSAWGQHYEQTNLVSNLGSLAPKTDANLVNGWGISRSSSSPWWVSDNGTGKATLYDGEGNARPLVVTVPGAPTGTVFNGSSDFQLTGGQPARFLFASEDGTISGWNPAVDPTNAIVKVTTPGAVYKGLTIAVDHGKRMLYAADFHGGRIDVFDASFQPVTRGRRESDEDGGAFRFEGKPRGFSPFNIQNIGENLVIAFAKPDAEGADEIAGPGNGLIGVFTTSGKLIRWFEHVDALNAPWGLALAPNDFGSLSHHIISGQFGSGELLAFNLETGKFVGHLLTPAGQPIVIDGLWGIGFGNGGTAGPANNLFFAAGPNDEKDGLFGVLKPVPADLIQGNGN